MKSWKFCIRKLRERYTPHYALPGFMDFLYGLMESSATGYRSTLSLENIGKVILNNMSPVLILVGKKIPFKSVV